ncbi:MAG TPA: ABC transporter permease [Acidimicrobiales bacterium]|nr:ABC transporter permease [Acidimicrobiales bacterium]
MTGFVIRRLAQAVIVVLLVTFIMFVLLHLLPGSPARAELGVKAQPQAIAAFNKLNGFDKPLWEQYFLYVGRVFEGNLGFSYRQNASVVSLVVEYLPKTAILLGLSVVVSVLVAIPLGVYQAVRRNRWDDYVVTGGAFFFYSFPTFFLGAVLIQIFSISLHWLPSHAPQGNTVGALFSQWTALILPVATLSLVSIASYSRYMRSAMIDSLAQDYIRTAKAKGLSRRAVLFGHALRNSLIPMATLLGLSIPYILGGAIITEYIFNYPGIGLLFIQSAQSLDFAVLLGLTLLAAISTIVGNLVADIAYGVLDPRIRY